jgi:hypothetical protein
MKKQPTSDERIRCRTHGEGELALVCRHITDGLALLWFGEAPGVDNPWPAAWCEKCEAVRLAHGDAWDAEASDFAAMNPVCHECYLAAKGGGAPGVPESLRFTFKCGACDAWHHELPDWGARLPDQLVGAEDRPEVLIGDELCHAGADHFIRGCLDLPIVGHRERLSFGVWTSLSEASLERVHATWDDDRRAQQPPFFGWLCTRLPGYPDTTLLKAMVFPRPRGERPLVVLEPNEHPLAQDQREGVSVARARKLVRALLEQ